MAKYMTPDFDVTVYEIEDKITASFEDNEEGWGASDVGGSDWD